MTEVLPPSSTTSDRLGDDTINVLVTGASGFIGRRLCETLLSVSSRRYQVFGLVRKTTNPKMIISGVTPVQGDLNDVESLKPIVKEKSIEIVVHLGADIDFHPRDSTKPFRTNVDGTKNILEACTQPNSTVKRFIYASSQEAMGPVDPRQAPVNEDAECNPTFIYGKSKLAAENLIREYVSNNNNNGGNGGLSYVILRITGVMGPGDSYAFYDVLKAVSNGLLLVYPGKCDTHGMWVHVDDVVQAIILSMNKDAARNETFIIGPEQPLTYRELLDVCSDALGRKHLPLFHMPLPIFRALTACISPFVNLFCRIRGSTKNSFLFHPDAVTAMSEERWYSIDKAKRLLGYQPRYTMEQAVRVTVEHNLRCGLLKTAQQRNREYLRLFAIAMAVRLTAAAIFIYIYRNHKERVQQMIQTAKQRLRLLK